MNNKQAILDFLKDLSINNSKEWMDDNRNRYTFAKDAWLELVQQILTMLSKRDNSYFNNFIPKDCISRITNNRMYNPNLPVYKDFFTFSIMDKKDGFPHCTFLLAEKIRLLAVVIIIQTKKP
ncbi:MAG: DUF2461 domain-containing protein [Chloroflexia bacterium]|nr:DUF2461 domain-containing protein [Chloroflexia bacterium]